MLSRRRFLIGAVAAGAMAVVRPPASVRATASQPSTPVNFAVPKGACDCHTHIFCDPQRFPRAHPRSDSSFEPASVEENRALHRALHMDRVIIVQEAIYGTDNACALDAIRQLGPHARGVAVIDDKIPKEQLDEMDRAGMRGIRLIMRSSGQADPDADRQQFQKAIERIAGRRWHIQVATRLSVIESLQKEVRSAPVPVVFDHFGFAQASLGPGQAGFGTLLSLVRSGKAYVKLSGLYLVSNQGLDYLDAAPLAKALIAANPQRILWGSDWPHPGATSPIDDGRMLNQLAVWAPDAGLRRKILVENPARLYGF
jgi:predicted TIM-barrel fold metal-dependent hydrolase